jgi:hypothetical protein
MYYYHYLNTIILHKPPSVWLKSVNNAGKKI